MPAPKYALTASRKLQAAERHARLLTSAALHSTCLPHSSQNWDLPHPSLSACPWSFHDLTCTACLHAPCSCWPCVCACCAGRVLPLDPQLYSSGEADGQVNTTTTTLIVSHCSCRASHCCCQAAAAAVICAHAWPVACAASHPQVPLCRTGCGHCATAWPSAASQHRFRRLVCPCSLLTELRFCCHLLAPTAAHGAQPVHPRQHRHPHKLARHVHDALHR